MAGSAVDTPVGLPLCGPTATRYVIEEPVNSSTAPPLCLSLCQIAILGTLTGVDVGDLASNPNPGVNGTVTYREVKYDPENSGKVIDVGEYTF